LVCMTSMVIGSRRRTNVVGFSKVAPEVPASRG
jgi:hypothetical protein